jgi:cobalamin biosynthetic protein CobC
MDMRGTIPERRDELRYHGGNINLARSRFPHAPRPWIDLSTGINPLPYPVGEIAASAWSRLPEPADVAALEAAARTAYGAAPAVEIVAAPGTQALIQWISRIIPARRVGVLGFTYGEHETCWRSAGADVVMVEALADLNAFDVAVVVNPNNPDGRHVPPDLLAEVARSLARSGGLLIVDEAFMDVRAVRDSLVPDLPAAGAVVLRSFGKIYGLAGLRLGFAAASSDIAATLRQAIGPWAVSGPAIELGRRALSDASWLTATVARLRGEATRLDRLLQAAGFEVAGGTPLFRLAARRDAFDWFEHLGRAGILTRPFLTRPDWLRFGIPHAPEHWMRLEAALRVRDNNGHVTPSTIVRDGE